MEITVRTFRNAHIIEAKGELDLYNAHLLREAAQRAAQTGARAIILNLKAVHYIDSSGVAALLSINAQLVGKARHFRIAHLSRPVLRVIELTRLTGFSPLRPPSSMQSNPSDPHRRVEAQPAAHPEPVKRNGPMLSLPLVLCLQAGSSSSACPATKSSPRDRSISSPR